MSQIIFTAQWFRFILIFENKFWNMGWNDLSFTQEYLT